MIRINLVPEELRRKRRPVRRTPAVAGPPRELVAAIIGGTVVLLLLVHAVLQSVILMDYTRRKALQAQMEELAEDKAHIDQVMRRVRAAREQVQALEGILGDRRLSWARVLNAVSDQVPEGVWLNRMLFEEDTLLIEGSSLARQEDEVSGVYAFIANLKKSVPFSSDFGEILTAGPIKGRRVHVTPLADFVIEARLKPAEGP